MQSQSQTQTQHIHSLISQVSNTHQIQSLQKINGRTEQERLYLCTFIPASTTHPTFTIDNGYVGTFQIFGSLQNKRSSNVSPVREKYNVDMFHKEGINTFSCSCMDYKLNHNRLNRVCKHICFIVCKFGEIYDATYFNSQRKTLSEPQFQHLLQKAQRFIDVSNERISSVVENDPNLRECFQSTSTPLPSQSSSQSRFTEQRPRSRPIYMPTHKTGVPPFIRKNIDFTDLTKHIWTKDETCPICFDDISNDTNTNKMTLACPTCHNLIHKECMQIWLNTKKTCIMCRDSIWMHYRA